MAFDPSVATQIQPVKIESPLTTLGQLATLRAAQTENLLRQQQIRESAARIANDQLKTQRENRDYNEQRQIANIVADPANHKAFFEDGDFTKLTGAGFSPTNVDPAVKFLTGMRTTALQQTKEARDQFLQAKNELGPALMTATDSKEANDLLHNFGSLSQTNNALVQKFGYFDENTPFEDQRSNRLKINQMEINALEGAAAAQEKQAKAKTADIQAQNLAAVQPTVVPKAQAELTEAQQKAAQAQAQTPVTQAITAATLADKGLLTPEQRAQAIQAQARTAVERSAQALRQRQFDVTFGAGLDANGQPIPADAMKTAALNDPVAVAIADYRMAPPPAQTRGGIPSPIMRKVLAIDPNYQATEYPARSKTALAYSPGGEQGKQLTATETALRHLHSISEAGAALKNGDIPALNAIANTIGAQTGASPKTTYDTIVSMVAPEISKAVIGQAGGEGERQQMQKNFSSSAADNQRENAIGAATKLLGARMEQTLHAYEQQMGKPLARDMTPEAKAVMQKYGASPQSAAGSTRINTKEEYDKLPSGSRYIDASDGKTYIKK